MKKQISIILVFILIISFCISCENNKIFLIQKNNSTLILYNKNIYKKEINTFIENYSSIIYNFYNKNKLTEKNILEENLTFILCKESFLEINNNLKNIHFLLNKTLKNKPDYLNQIIKSIDNSFPNNELSFKANKAIALFKRNEDGSGPLIFLKYSNSYLKYIFLIAEYNHFLIVKNNSYFSLSSNENIIFSLIFDEGITNYLGFLLLNVYPNPGNLLMDSFIQFGETYAIKQTLRYLYQNKSNFKNSSKIMFNKLDTLIKGTITEINEEDFLSVISFFDVAFFDYILKKYGLNKFYELISFIYNNRYSSLNDITEFLFNISFNKFYEQVKLYCISLIE